MEVEGARATRSNHPMNEHANHASIREPPGCDPADRVCPGAFCCCKCGCGSGRVLCPPAAAGAGRVGSWGARVRVTRRVNPGPRPSSVSTSQLHAQLTTLIILAILGLTAWASVLGPAGRSPRSIMTDLDPVLSPLCWWCLGSVGCRNRLFGRWVDRLIDRLRSPFARSLDRQLACSLECYLSSIARSPSH